MMQPTASYRRSPSLGILTPSCMPALMSAIKSCRYAETFTGLE